MALGQRHARHQIHEELSFPRRMAQHSFCGLDVSIFKRVCMKGQQRVDSMVIGSLSTGAGLSLLPAREGKTLNNLLQRMKVPPLFSLPLQRARTHRHQRSHSRCLLVLALRMKSTVPVSQWPSSNARSPSYTTQPCLVDRQQGHSHHTQDS